MVQPLPVGRGISWSNWLEERDAAPLEMITGWFRDQAVPKNNDKRSPALNVRTNRLDELCRELFNALRRGPGACTVEQADLVSAVEAIAAIKNRDVEAAKVRCETKLRSGFGPPDLVLPFEMFLSYLRPFIVEVADDERSQEVILQQLLVKAHLERESRAADLIPIPFQDETTDENRRQLQLAETQKGSGMTEIAVAIATPQRRCRRARKKQNMFGAVCG
jgi:hypothetical protein